MRFSTVAEWLKWQETLNPKTIDLGLDRVRAVVERMSLSGSPFPILTVGGTNGKGSTVAMLETILRRAAYRVGAYTSPHLVRYNERVRIDGTDVSDADLCTAFQRVDDARGDVPLTYFEFGTVAAMDLFMRANLDVAVLEVGLGGRLDAVNVWDADVAVITTVALDHTEWLGANREDIAFEKAGILRSGRPAVFGERDVPRRLREHAANIGATLYAFGSDYSCALENSAWRWNGPARTRYALPIPALRGAHQLQNASAALMALELMQSRLPVTAAAVRDGLAQVYVPGRFEVKPGAVTQIFDVAHNPQGAQAFAATLKSQPCGGRTIAVFGMLADKDIVGTLQPLAGMVDCWFIGAVDSPRAASTALLERALKQVDGATPVVAVEQLRDAYRRALREARDGDRVVIFGSFYSVAGAV